MNTDALVAGAGPAGLAAAAACVERGLRVVIVDPRPDAPWSATYAAWLDELPAGVPVHTAWPQVGVRTGADRLHVEARPYGRIDGAALRAELLRRASGAEFVTGSVEAVTPNGAGRALDGSVVRAAGAERRARIVIDARGGRGATHFQTAYGLVAEASGLDSALPSFMDFSTRFGDGSELPTFLYALPFADGTWLVEETALVRRPAVPLELLEARLRDRLARAGVTLGPTRATERCVIGMDVAVPPRTPAVVHFGAAAGMVHPASGYSVARALRTAPGVADAVAAGLSAGGPSAAADLAFSVIWPGDSLRRNRLHRYGATAIASLGADDTRAFFSAFFSMPAAFRTGYLGDRLSATSLVAGMASLFGRLPTRLRLRLLAAGDATELVRAMATSNQHPSSTPEAV